MHPVPHPEETRTAGGFLLLLLLLGRLFLAAGEAWGWSGDAAGAQAYSRLAAARPAGHPNDLEGTLFVLDPGHGGSASGMVAPGGLREADANLAVAHALAAALRSRGARVVMTRTGDRDLEAHPFRLGQELRGRARLASDLGADLFVSLHHNATPDIADPVALLRKNRTEVYYRQADPTSRGVAEKLLASLGRLTRHARSRAYSSNFAVLRHNDAPALLGEPFYLSVPLWEAYTRHDAFPPLEARLYERVLARFAALRQEPPRILSPWPGEPITTKDLDVHLEVPWGTEDRSIEEGLLLDGETHPRVVLPVPARPSAASPDRPEPRRRVIARFPSIEVGPHRLSWEWSTGGDGGTRVEALVAREFVARSEPHRVSLELHPARPPRSYDGPLLLHISVRDRHGRPATEGTTALVSWRGGATIVKTSAGAAIFEIGRGPEVLRGHLRVACGSVRVRRSLKQEEAPAEAGVGTAGEPRVFWGVLRDDRTGEVPAAIPPSRPARHPSELRWFADPRTGLYILESPPSPAGPLPSFTLSLPGYLPVRLSPDATRNGATHPVTSVLEGRLRGLRVGLDLQQTASPASRRALELTRAALTAAGAFAVRGPPGSLDTRALHSNMRKDQFFISFASSESGSTRLLHYPGSRKGVPLARSVAQALDRAAIPADSGHYLLSNTSGTALLIHPAEGLDPAVLAFSMIEGLYRLHGGPQGTVGPDRGLSIAFWLHPGEDPALREAHSLSVDARGELHLVAPSGRSIRHLPASPRPQLTF